MYLILLVLAVSLYGDALGAKTSLSPYQEQQANRHMERLKEPSKVKLGSDNFKQTHDIIYIQRRYNDNFNNKRRY